MADSVHQFLPEAAQWDIDKLRESIQRTGLWPGFEPEEDVDGNILDGHQRKTICDELGIPYVPRVRERFPVDTETGEEMSAWDYVWTLNVARRHLSPRERRALAKEWLSRHTSESNRRIAKRVGLDDHTVASVRAELEADDQISKTDSVLGIDGKVYDFRNRAETQEAQRIQRERTPVDAADHRNECWMEFRYGYPCPADAVRARGELVYRRDSDRREWVRDADEGPVMLTRKAPTNDSEMEAVAEEIKQAILREWRIKPPLTMDPQVTAWR